MDAVFNMNKRIVSRLQAFQREQRRNARYHVSWYTPHEQAIKEHILRGFGDGLTRVAHLLDQKNKR
jgi:hypothetical protein